MSNIVVTFRAKVSMRFYQRPDSLQLDGDGERDERKYEMPACCKTFAQKMHITLWNTSDHDLARYDNVSSDTLHTFEIDWSGRNRTDILVIAAFIEDRKVQVGNLFIPLTKLRDEMQTGGYLQLEHAFEKHCVVHMQLETATSEELAKLDAAIHNSTESPLKDIAKMNQLATKMNEHTIKNIELIANKCGGQAFFPGWAGGTQYASLMTQLPVWTEAQDSLCMSMAMLQKTMQGRGASVSLYALAYLTHAACLMEGIRNNDEWTSGTDMRTVFRVFVQAQTLLTAEGGFDVYTPDRVPMSYEVKRAWDGNEVAVINYTQTENIQAPLTQVKVAGDDCEDWAMVMLMVALSFTHHKGTVEAMLTNDNDRDYFRHFKQQAADRHDKGPFVFFDKQQLKNILLKIKFIAKAIEQKQLTTVLATVSAGAPSMKSGQGQMWTQPSGHECAFSQLIDGTHNRAKVLEGTNWVNNVREYSMQACKDMTKLAMNDCKQKKGENPRHQMLQHVGTDVASGEHSNSFYRCIYAMDDRLLMTVDEHKNNMPVMWGAHVDDVLASCSEQSSNVAYLKLNGGGISILEFTDYRAFIEGISKHVQAPMMTVEDWKRRLINCPAMEPDPPKSFKDASKHKNTFEDQRAKKGKMYAYYATKNNLDGSFPFMNSYISCVSHDVEDGAVKT